MLVLLLAAGCGSSDLGGILGGGSDSGGMYSNEVRGTVDYVDTRNQYIDLRNATGYRSNLGGSSSSGNVVRVYYDSRTTVEYQGRNYQVADLERGDEVTIRVNENNNQLVADAINVTYNSAGDRAVTGGTQTSTIRGTVRYIDTSRREIEVDRGTYNGGTTVVQYDTNTYVDFNNRRYNVADLERGDEIEISVRDLGSGRMFANNIHVIRSVSGGSSSSGTYGNTSMSTVRGTVRSIDTRNRTITLDQTSWRSGFNQGNSTSNTMIVSYDSNTDVEFNGRTYAVTNLERGDVIDVSVRDMGGSRLAATRIYVVRDVNSNF